MNTPDGHPQRIFSLIRGISEISESSWTLNSPSRSLHTGGWSLLLIYGMTVNLPTASNRWIQNWSRDLFLYSEGEKEETANNGTRIYTDWTDFRGSNTIYEKSFIPVILRIFQIIEFIQKRF